MVLGIFPFLLAPLADLEGIVPGRVVVELPTDPSVKVYIGFHGWWRSLETGRMRLAELRAQISVFGVGEKVVEEEADKRAFVEAQRFEEREWKEVVPADDVLGMVVLILDEKRRLGRAVVKGLYADEPEGEIEAEPDGGKIEGTLEVFSHWLYYNIQVLDREGKPLFTLCARSSSEVEWCLEVRLGSFKPYALRMGGCPCPFVIDFEQETIGDPEKPRDPEEAPGHTSPGCMTRSYYNDKPVTAKIRPPRQFWRRKVLGSTISAGILSRAKTGAEWVLKFLEEDPTPVVAPVEVPPFSKGCVGWGLEFSGEFIAVIGVPYYKVADKPWMKVLEALCEETWKHLVFRVVKSTVWVAVINRILQGSKAAREKTGLKPGDVVAVGDAWALRTTLMSAHVEGVNLLEEVTIEVTGECGMKGRQVKIIRGEAWTKPEPPNFPDPEPVYPSSQALAGRVIWLDEEGKARVKLGKGWIWKVRAIPPEGFAPAEEEIKVPTDRHVTLKCPLVALLNLYVYTYQGGKLAPALVELYVREGSGPWALVSSSESTVSEVPKGQEVKHPARVVGEKENIKVVFYPAVFHLLWPGKSYKLKAYGLGGGEVESEPFAVVKGCELVRSITIPFPFESPPFEGQPPEGSHPPEGEPLGAHLPQVRGCGCGG